MSKGKFITALSSAGARVYFGCLATLGAE